MSVRELIEAGRKAQRQAEEDGFVECSECGHPIEQHDPKGCRLAGDECTCTEKWTQLQIRAARESYGLPASQEGTPE
jgi:hypothetical protein